MTSYTFVVDGPPAGKGRARFVRQTGRAFTPKQTELAENRVVYAWQQLRADPIAEGPVGLSIIAVMARPKMHRLASGALSSVGRRSEWPTKKPDWDNIAKLIGDALNGFAYRDDAQVVSAQVIKRWADADEHERLIVQLWSIPVSTMAAVA